eukprot:c26275_g1_i1.p1 GENE.c26275_g1_i1~~c26275_g1_i1.p1  ORF type:complete len:291 (+),score=26.19 c26275_g1_i1:79-873(+)
MTQPRTWFGISLLWFCVCFTLATVLGESKADQETRTSKSTRSRATTCADYNLCTDCIPVTGCGWCSRNSTCMLGTSTGARRVSCGGEDWNYFTCPALTCNSFTTCSECTMEPTCGWCASSQTCLSGDASGPSSGSCAHARWGWYSAACKDNCELTCNASVAVTACRGASLGIYTKTGRWCYVNGVDSCCHGCCRLSDGVVTACVLAPLFLIFGCVLGYLYCRKKRRRRQHTIEVELSHVVPIPIEDRALDLAVPHAIASPIPCG